MYILGESPKGDSEAYNALEDVFGTEQFSSADAMGAIASVLGVEHGGASNEFARLLRARHIVEV